VLRSFRVPACGILLLPLHYFYFFFVPFSVATTQSFGRAWRTVRRCQGSKKKTKIRKGRNKKRRSKITKQDEKGDTKKWREGEALVRPQRIGSKKGTNFTISFFDLMLLKLLIVWFFLQRSPIATRPQSISPCYKNKTVTVAVAKDNKTYSDHRQRLSLKF